MARSLNLVVLVFCQIFTLIALSLEDSCTVADVKRLDCGWHGINAILCESRNCCWRSAQSPFPWCFFDSATATRLKTATACEHNPPVILKCFENETISVHDVFYGRNDGNRTCHNSGTTTCFNPKATDIVNNMCRNSSKCEVSPSGSIWNFDATCDRLNAQLIVHYICVLKATSSSIAIASDTPSPSTVGRTEMSTVFETSSSSFESSSSYESSSSDFMSTSSTSLFADSSSTMWPTDSITGTATSLIAPSISDVRPSPSSVAYSSTAISAAPGSSSSTESASKTESILFSVSQGAGASSSMPPSLPRSAFQSNSFGTLTQSISFSVPHTSQGVGASSSIPPSLPPSATQSNSFGTFTAESISSSFSTKTDISTPSSVSYNVDSTSLGPPSSKGSSVPTSHSFSPSRSQTSFSKHATSSIMPTASPPDVSGKNTGKQSQTTYIAVGVSVGVVILCLILAVWYVKKRNSTRHEMLTNDVLAAPKGLYYGVSLNEVSPGYDNPLEVTDGKGPEAVMNELYVMNSS